MMNVEWRKQWLMQAMRLHSIIYSRCMDELESRIPLKYCRMWGV